MEVWHKLLKIVEYIDGKKTLQQVMLHKSTMHENIDEYIVFVYTKYDGDFVDRFQNSITQTQMNETAHIQQVMLTKA